MALKPSRWRPLEAPRSFPWALPKLPEGRETITFRAIWSPRGKNPSSEWVIPEELRAAAQAGVSRSPASVQLEVSQISARARLVVGKKLASGQVELS